MASATGRPDDQSIQDVASEAPGQTGDIVVTGIRQSLATAQSIKRNADTVVDAISAEDLVANATHAGPRVQAVRGDVETFVAREGRTMTDACVVVDPPRTGLAPTVVTGLVAARPRRVVYVSCDPATLARDLQALVAGGLRIDRMTVFDLFPVTAHVETVVTLSAARSAV